MNYSVFIESLGESKPPSQASPALQALWYDSKGDWHSAHDLINDLNDSISAWVHAYLHRKEGDTGNAGYWYRRAGKPFPAISLEKEWETITQALLNS